MRRWGEFSEAGEYRVGAPATRNALASELDPAALARLRDTAKQVCRWQLEGARDAHNRREARVSPASLKQRDLCAVELTAPAELLL